MAILSYNVVLFFIGLLCCLHQQTNGNSSSELYLLEKTENSFDENYINDNFNQVMWSSDKSNHNTQFWNKVSDFFNHKFKVLELFVSNINLWNLDETEYQNFSSMPTKKLFSTHEINKLNMNTSKRIPRNANYTQISSTVTSKNESSSTIYLEPSISVIEKSTPNIKHSIPMSTINNTDQLFAIVTINSTISPVVINSTPMNEIHQPLPSYTVIIDNHTIPDNSTNNEKIDILSNSLPYEPDYYGIPLLVLGAIIILVIGIFIAYKKYQDTGRQAIYQIGGMCYKVHEETPI